MSEFKVSSELAISEVDNLIATKKMRPAKIQRLQACKDIVVEAIMCGDVSLDLDNGKIVQTLRFPLGENQSITALTYNTRIAMKTLNAAFAKLKNLDGQSKIDATIEQMTNIMPSQVMEMEATDKEVAEAIAVFFT